MKVTSLAVQCLLLNLNPFTEVKADQPVHCLRESIFGVWNFQVHSEQQKVNLFETQEVCTHNVPNKIQLLNQGHQFSFDKMDTYRMNVMDNYKVEAVLCKNGEKCGQEVIKGHWTSIYDQAFNIELDNGMRFLANFRYNIKPEISKDPFQDAISNGVGKFAAMETGDYDKFNSECTSTMVGFVQNIPAKTGHSFSMQQHEVQCFYGQMEKHYDIEKTEAVNTGKMKYNKIVQTNNYTPEHIAGETPKLSQQNQSAPSESSHIQQSSHKKKHHQAKQAHRKRGNMHLEHKPSDEVDLLISAVNEADLGWKADVCKYQKHHANYGDHCDVQLAQEKVSLAQITSQSKDDDFVEQAVDEGEESNKTPEFGVEGDKAFEAALAKAQTYMKKFNSAAEIPDSALPESLDFRNIDGYDFTSYFRNQAHCGSCYTISFTQVMEARLKLKYGKQPPMLSPQMLMTCNYMNEACDGGWPHFNVFLAENAHLVSEECAPYKGKSKGDHCGNYEQCKPISKVDQSYFVGGGWGATSEKQMMKEILRNGPINGDFQAPSMFSLYKEGIFSEKGLIGLKNKHERSLIELFAQTDVISEDANSEESDADSEADVDADSEEGRRHKAKKRESEKAPSSTTLNDKGISWMDMNHSVVIIGWGVDKKDDTKYWIVRNSYGEKWGMNGDFMVKRGNNDFGMEVEQIAFEPRMCGADSTDVCL